MRRGLRSVLALGAGVFCETEDELVQQQHAPLRRDEVAVVVQQEPALQVRLCAAVFDPAGGDALQDPEPEEHFLEVGVRGFELLGAADAYLEEVFLRLRILQGIPASWVEDGRAEPYLQSGLLLDDDGNLVPTERGMLLLNELVLGLTEDAGAQR